MNESDQSDDREDPGRKVAGCMRWMLAVPLFAFGLFAVFWGMVCLIFGGPEGKIGDPQAIGFGLVFNILGLLSLGLATVMIYFSRQNKSD